MKSLESGCISSHTFLPAIQTCLYYSEVSDTKHDNSVHSDVILNLCTKLKYFTL